MAIDDAPTRLTQPPFRSQTAGVFDGLDSMRFKSTNAEGNVTVYGPATTRT
jgi:hypothetical protein